MTKQEKSIQKLIALSKKLKETSCKRIALRYIGDDDDKQKKPFFAMVTNRQFVFQKITTLEAVDKFIRTNEKATPGYKKIGVVVNFKNDVFGKSLKEAQKHEMAWPANHSDDAGDQIDEDVRHERIRQIYKEFYDASGLAEDERMIDHQIIEASKAREAKSTYSSQAAFIPS